VPDRIDVGGVAVATQIDGVPAPISGLANDVRNKINGAVAGALDKSTFKSAFEKLSHDSVAALMAKLQPPSSAKIDEIRKVDKIWYGGGVLRIQVKGKRIDWPGSPDTKAALAALRDASKSPAPTKGVAPGPMTMPAGKMLR
jgi:hypothetical protein